MDMELNRIEAPYVFELNAKNDLKLVYLDSNTGQRIDDFFFYK